LAHALSNLPRQDRIQLAFIIWLPRVFCFQQIEQIVGPWQAADMRGLDVIGILLDGHWCSSEFTFENPAPFSERTGAPLVYGSAVSAASSHRRPQGARTRRRYARSRRRSARAPPVPCGPGSPPGWPCRGCRALPDAYRDRGETRRAAPLP